MRKKPTWLKPAKSSREVIQRMEELFTSRRRWIKRSYHDFYENRFCLLGAMNYVKDGTAPQFTIRAQQRIHAAANKLFRPADGSARFFSGVAHFNDEPVRKFDDIQRVLRHARRAR